MAGGVTQHAREKAHGGIGHHQGRELAPREHKIAERKNVGGPFLSDALIHSFVVTAQKDDMWCPGELACVTLLESLPRRVKEHDGGLLTGVTGLQRGIHNRGHHHHAGASSVTFVIDRAVRIGGKVAGILGPKRHVSGLFRPQQDAMSGGGQHHFGKQRDKVDFERHARRLPVFAL
jgi:hypothetical protein